jgi:hypothetical protein
LAAVDCLSSLLQFALQQPLLGGTGDTAISLTPNQSLENRQPILTLSTADQRPGIL